MTESELAVTGSKILLDFSGQKVEDPATKETFVDSAVGSTTAESSSSLSPSIEMTEPIIKSGYSTQNLALDLKELFSENVLAKIWRVAVKELKKEVWSNLC